MEISKFLNSLLDRASKNLQTIVLPEGEDERILQAAHIIAERKAAKIIILGNPEEIKAYYAKNSWNLDGIEILHPESSERLEEYSNLLYELRKSKGMTQNDLAEKMNVTDKAVSKWERNLSCPDVNSIPKLAEVLGVSVEELLNAQTKQENSKVNDIINIALIGIGLAMGICIVVTSILKQIDMNNAITMLGIGVSCLSIYLLKNKNDKQ